MANSFAPVWIETFVEKKRITASQCWNQDWILCQGKLCKGFGLATGLGDESFRRPSLPYAYLLSSCQSWPTSWLMWHGAPERWHKSWIQCLSRILWKTLIDFREKSLKRQGEEILWYMWAIPSTHHEDSKLGRLEGLVFLREISREKRCMALYGGWSLWFVFPAFFTQLEATVWARKNGGARALSSKHSGRPDTKVVKKPWIWWSKPSQEWRIRIFLDGVLMISGARNEVVSGVLQRTLSEASKRLRRCSKYFPRSQPPKILSCQFVSNTTTATTTNNNSNNSKNKKTTNKNNNNKSSSSNNDIIIIIIIIIINNNNNNDNDSNSNSNSNNNSNNNSSNNSSNNNNNNNSNDIRAIMIAGPYAFPSEFAGGLGSRALPRSTQSYLELSSLLPRDCRSKQLYGTEPLQPGRQGALFVGEA